jgi:branched-subunit amino acid aminotransferase/4-amino-4-deoxychorismate lyase
VVEQVILREMLYIAGGIFFCGTAVEITLVLSPTVFVRKSKKILRNIVEILLYE